MLVINTGRLQKKVEAAHTEICEKSEYPFIHLFDRLRNNTRTNSTKFSKADLALTLKLRITKMETAVAKLTNFIVVTTFSPVKFEIPAIYILDK
jgi:hypothetical protein